VNFPESSFPGGGGCSKNRFLEQKWSEGNSATSVPLLQISKNYVCLISPFFYLETRGGHRLHVFSSLDVSHLAFLYLSVTARQGRFSGG
jgi:hypothetical protein